MATYFISGAASGIGYSVARLALDEGHGAVCVDRCEAVYDLFKDDSNALPQVFDLLDSEACSEAVIQACESFGGIDGLSHNAGIQRYGTAQDTQNETWEEVLGANLTGAFHLARAALPSLRMRAGSLVFMGSVQSLATQQNAVAYTVSKHGLLGLARSIAVDFAAESVRSNLVAPGAVDTPMLDWAVSLADDPVALRSTLNCMHPLGRVATSMEIAQVVLFLLSDRASFVTGEVVRVDGGLLTQLVGTPRRIET